MFTLTSVPVIWSIHFLFCYVIVSLACTAGTKRAVLFGLSVVEAGVGIATLLAVALLSYIGVISHARWIGSAQQASGDGRAERFCGLCTMLLSILSILVVLWVALPVALLPPCAA
ncbi:hypothetical protein [Massilia glaciei]|uniref:hypothetical protein n=1 Tax=Massilia glaciei TaxID=1524097 RepID=UPI0015E7FFA6|nr:hypothetical protein [Massilia glaciei]